MEGALFIIPKGYLSLREAVIRLAETRAPEARVRRYLQEDHDEALWRAIMASWPADAPFDWPDIANVAATAPPSLAWGALEAARDEMRQALGDAGLIGVLQSLSTGVLAPSKPERWRIGEGFAAFQRGRLGGGDVLLCEADFVQWMVGDAPSIATEANATTPGLETGGCSPPGDVSGQITGESQYPAMGDVPEHHHLTACEVLTWIGYGRAISKDVYFAPFAKASGPPTEERSSLPYRSVPDPKPPEDPMGDAERKLMDMLRPGLVHMFIERNGAFEEVPNAIYEHTVAVNARGSVEADAKATERDQMRACSYLSSLPPIGDVWFRKAEVLEAWPNIAPGDDGEPRPVEATGTPAAIPGKKPQLAHKPKQDKLKDALLALQNDGEDIQSPVSIDKLHERAMKKAGLAASKRTFERARQAALTDVVQSTTDC